MKSTSGQRSPILRQQIAQRDESPAPELARVGDLGGPARGPRHGIDAAQHGEDPRQGLYVARHELSSLGCLEALQVAAQGVDDAVDGLERHPLLLAAAAGEHHRCGAFRQVLEEPVNQGGLARPGAAADKERGHFPCSHGSKGIGEGRQMPRTAGQGGGAALVTSTSRQTRRPLADRPPASARYRHRSPAPPGRARAAPSIRTSARRSHTADQPATRDGRPSTSPPELARGFPGTAPGPPGLRRALCPHCTSRRPG